MLGNLLLRYAAQRKWNMLSLNVICHERKKVFLPNEEGINVEPCGHLMCSFTAQKKTYVAIYTHVIVYFLRIDWVDITDFLWLGFFESLCMQRAKNKSVSISNSFWNCVKLKQGIIKSTHNATCCQFLKKHTLQFITATWFSLCNFGNPDSRLHLGKAISKPWSAELSL